MDGYGQFKKQTCFNLAASKLLGGLGQPNFVIGPMVSE